MGKLLDALFRARPRSQDMEAAERFREEDMKARQAIEHVVELCLYVKKNGILPSDIAVEERLTSGKSKVYTVFRGPITLIDREAHEDDDPYIVDLIAKVGPSIRYRGRDIETSAVTAQQVVRLFADVIARKEALDLAEQAEQQRRLQEFLSLAPSSPGGGR